MSIKLQTVNRLVLLIGGTGAIIQIQYISFYFYLHLHSIYIFFMPALLNSTAQCYTAS